MHGMSLRRSAAALCLLLAGLGGAWAAEPAAPIALAHSGLLSLQGTNADGGLVLRVQGGGGATPAVTAVSVRESGLELPAMHRSDGSWFVSGRVPGSFEVVVDHDGIRELLAVHPAAAPVSVPAAAPTSNNRKQLIWWVLNIAIVAIAALVISRRVS